MPAGAIKRGRVAAVRGATSRTVREKTPEVPGRTSRAIVNRVLPGARCRDNEARGGAKEAMEINRLHVTIGLAPVIFAAGVALVFPPFRGSERAPYTLVSNDLSMSPKSRDWLALEDERDPAEWLAARSTPPLDATQLAVRLSEAARHYEETPRMIANRIAQIEDQFQGVDSLALLADFTMETGRARSFGAVAQHYLVLRRQGIDHETALATLREDQGGAE